VVRLIDAGAREQAHGDGVGLVLVPTAGGQSCRAEMGTVLACGRTSVGPQISWMPRREWSVDDASKESTASVTVAVCIISTLLNYACNERVQTILLDLVLECNVHMCDGSPMSSGNS
jgi:hypothetical protein